MWGNMRQFTFEKLTNANIATLYLLRRAIWSRIWQLIMVKSCFNVTNVIINWLGQTISGDIWRLILVRRCFNATNVTINRHGETIWGHIWRLTLENRHSITISLFKSINLLSIVMKPSFLYTSEIRSRIAEAVIVNCHSNHGIIITSRISAIQ